MLLLPPHFKKGILCALVFCMMLCKRASNMKNWQGALIIDRCSLCISNHHHARATNIKNRRLEFRHFKMESEKLIGNQDPKGLTIFTASVFLAGEMAGSGVLALPAALTGTGWSGLILILFFSLNAAYIGSRLGLCWELLAGSGLADELKQSHVRDPYPLIAEKAGALKGPLIGKAFRYVATGKRLSKNPFMASLLDSVFRLHYRHSLRRSLRLSHHYC